MIDKAFGSAATRSDSYIGPGSHAVQPPEHPNATSTRPPAWHDGGHLQLTHAGLVVARFAHYVKALHRACYAVTGPDPSDLQRVLHAWLQQYVAPVDPSPGLYARRPLFGASIAVEWDRELSGMYRFHLHVRPHFASAGAPLSLSLVGGLDV